MTNRIRHVMVTLAEPFLLTNLDQPIPAGDYQITTEEEPLGDSMYSAYRRISATIYVAQVPGRLGVSQNIELTGSELSALLAHSDSVLE
jgi:hypothetical protein